MDTRANSAIEFVQWPVHSQLESTGIDDKVLAIQTTCASPINISGDNDFPYKKYPYKNFNLGLHVGDCANNVEHNRQCLQKLFPSKTRIQWLEQVHGNTVAKISKVTKENIIADAMVTREKNIALAIMTADCLPILLISSQGDEIAAIHGGWRPLAANIITNTLNKMHTAADDIYAWLGPCIGKEAFEVGSEVQRAFVEQGNAFSQAFIKQENGKYLANLHEIATLQLNKVGIKQISSLSECTYSQPEKYYSYRKNSITGRMATVISLL
ncbi:peptidoglycan editing factor PgeF [Candidatus Colwellia aromaticivorans]|uniref:peptidoglycan editing factor PgeF n=1 Tax=Candidatus Colwellia aromaticivorans TaxID=2267621 RepID=UPI001FE577A6|nr:peptidoglycan editing factor PgeF [Candidatus Colwellia aromaticivorans]